MRPSAPRFAVRLGLLALVAYQECQQYTEEFCEHICRAVLNEKEQIHPMRATLIAGANTLLVVVVVTVAFIHYRNIPHPHEPHG